MFRFPITTFVQPPPHLLRLSSRRALISRRPATPPAATRMSLIPFLPDPFVIAAWAFGAYRFYLGFNRTSYQSTYRIPLALAWPVLFAVNPTYRKNFTKSIKSADDDF